MHVKLQELYLAELEEARSARSQLAERLGDLAARASDQQLRQKIEEHREEAALHRDRIEQLIQGHANRPQTHSDGSMAAMLRETEKLAGMVDDPAVRDAGLIASLQRMEHYTIAVLGTLAAWARQLGHDRDAQVLTELLEQDKRADARLSQIAGTMVNPAAA